MPALRPCLKSLVIHGISVPRSASSACSTVGISACSSIRTSTAYLPLAALHRTTHDGSPPGDPSLRVCMIVVRVWLVRVGRFGMVGIVTVRVACLVQVLRLGLLRVHIGVLRDLLRKPVAFKYVNLGSGDAAAVHLADSQGRANAECGGRLVKHLRRNAGVDECGEKHVACDSGEAVEISNTHWDGLSGTVAVKLPIICRGPKRWPKRE